MYTKGYVLSDGGIIPSKLTDKVAIEHDMDDFLIQQFSRYDELRLVATYETDYEGDDNYYVPKEYR